MSATPTVPECVQAASVSLAAQVGCNQDVGCGCNSSVFLASFQSLIYQMCPDPNSALQQAQDFCTNANPHLLDTRRNTIIIPISIFAGLAVLAVIGRFYARRISEAKFGIDDWLSVGAVVFAMVSNILELYGLHNGEATHQFMVELDLVEASNKSTIATNWTTTFAILLLKLSILALYLRLFSAVRKFTMAVYAVGIFTTIMSIVMALLITVQCQPVAYFWNRAIPGGKCWNFQQLVVAVASVDLVTGLMVLPLPIPMLWGLQMSLGRKFAIAGLFLIGGFTCLAGALRIPFILLIDEYDIFWTLIPFTVFSALEVNVGYVSFTRTLHFKIPANSCPGRVISVCLPALRPLFGDWWMRTGLSGKFGSGSKKPSRLQSEDQKIYTGGMKAHTENGVWATKNSQPTDSQRILGRKSDEEQWPMSAVGVTREIDVYSKKGSGTDSFSEV